MKHADFKLRKEQQRKITMLTCYDYPSACIVAETAIDCVLIGDSVAMTVHGLDSTVMASMEMMIMHTAAVARGIKQQFIVSDLPFFSYRLSQEDSMNNVKRLLQAGAHAVKLEGADSDACKTITRIVDAGVPVMGHIGLTPQSVHQLSGYRVQGKSEQAAEKLLAQAQALEAAGCFALIIECVPATLAKTITESLSIPTIGIGAGVHTDGQVLVWHDLLGLQTNLPLRFTKAFADGKALLLQGVEAYANEVSKTQFPTPDHAF